MTLPLAAELILTVSEITRQVKETLAGSFPSVWVRGEVSGLKRAESGHLYFNLKDAEAVLACTIWRTAAARLTFEPRDGMQVEALGGITVYERRGSYQLSCQTLRPAGWGELLLALEELKRRLAAEGLFDPARKVPLPRFPRRVGLVTSPVGAAVRDLVDVLRRRWPPVEIVLAPVRVQGEGAAAEIAAAVRAFGRYGGVDVLIVGRGGGSLEDLWAFNEEAVVRAVAECGIPIVSAVGHEVDTTLCDFAADVRAATPSAAAELVVADRREVAVRVASLGQRADRVTRLAVAERRQQLERLVARYGFKRPRDYLGLVQQRVDDLSDRLVRRARQALARLRERLVRGDRLLPAARARVEAARQRTVGLEGRLRALGPGAVLERGYCLARRGDGSLVRSSAGLSPGDAVALQFARGGADARIERVRAPGGS